MTGGLGAGACGINSSSSGVVTITGNIINTSSALAYGGLYPPTYSPAGNANYIQYGNNKYPPQLDDWEVLHDTPHGDRTGTLAASNIGAATGTTDLSPDILKNGEQVDDVTGSFAGGGGLSAQEVANALLLAPLGEPAPGSVMDRLDAKVSCAAPAPLIRPRRPFCWRPPNPITPRRKPATCRRPAKWPTPCSHATSQAWKPRPGERPSQRSCWRPPTRRIPKTMPDS